MKLLPSENLVYVTRLSREEIINRLVRTPKYKPVNKGIGYDTFNLQRVIKYKNSFLPQIKGEIQEQGRNRLVKVEMNLQASVIIFVVIWLATLGLLTVLPFVTQPVEESGSFDYVPITMLVFGMVLFYGSFKFESLKSKKELVQILEAEL